ncbi:MAG TPA: TonB-dependent receptor, partial [Candidatus Baltobacteraceae bacterium]|nr:TonB-dependent receptor [Candidatus Baltobacteraceae bacterium]
MRRSFAVFTVAFISLLFVLSTAVRVSAQTSPPQSASITGTVTDETGAPIPNANVTLRGPATLNTQTDGKGAFAFGSVAPGIYTLSVNKAGYTPAVQSDITALSGQSSTIMVRLATASFSSLRTIAAVRTTGRGVNTTPASVNVVTTQDFIDQAQPQVTRVLSQVPGLQISFPSNSANAAAPGAITVPNIRAATSYETASLIDGHYISVGQYGDNVTTFLNSFMFGNVEVVKGPGADAPVVNNAIGGTTNFITKDPTLTPTPQFLFGFDSHGGTLSNLSFSDTIDRLGFIVDLATQNQLSALEGKQVYFDPSFGTYNGQTLNGNTGRTNIPGTVSNLPTQYPLVACCYTLHGNLDQTAELVKLRYKFSTATSMTVSYLGGQSYADQNGNTSDFINSQFIPGPGYTGSLHPGPIQVATIYPGAYSGEFNNEPIFQAEASTTLGKDTVIGRYYHATVNRYQYQGFHPDALDYNNVKLYGTSYDFSGNPVATFNGTPASVGFADFYTEPEIDKLTGGSFEYQHPLGQNDLLTFSADRTWTQSTDYSLFPNYPGTYYSFSLPPGDAQMLTTYMLRGHFYFGPKFEVTATDYYNTYNTTYAIGCVDQAKTGCNTQANAVFGTGVFFATTKNNHNDPRLGIVYRPTASSSVRLAVGSAIAPPFLGLLNQVTSTPQYGNGVAVESQSNGNLRPETAFGFDLGGDVQLRGPSMIVSGDVYQTNLFNRFFGQTVATGLVCGTAHPCGPGAPDGTPIYNQTNTNISNA